LSEENKTIVRRLADEIWNRRNPAIADALLAPKFVGHDPNAPETGRGPEAYKRAVNRCVAAFPDLKLTVDSVIAEGDLVVLRWTATGTHRGVWNDIAPTGRTATVTGISVCRVAGGKVHEEWAQWDAVGLMRQLGIVHPKTQAAGRHGAEM
jgi:steroid delta-isomerase-like uncharacterized protein